MSAATKSPLISNKPSPADSVLSLTTFYLVAPCLIFLLCWVQPWIGIPTTALLLLGILSFLRTLPTSPINVKLQMTDYWFAIGLALVWTFLSGVGGFVPQETDYIKHNLLFNDLVHRPWPVTYPQTPSGEGGYLCYGLGYYLVPSAATRLLGENTLPWLSYIWASFGLSLFFIWIIRLTSARKRGLLFFLFFAPSGILLLTLKWHGIPGVINPDSFSKTLWKLGLIHSYLDNFTKLQFQPQHGIVAGLGTVVLFELLWQRQSAKGVVLIWSACLFWSPLTCIGMLLIPLASFRRIDWRGYFNLSNFYPA